MQVKGFYLGRTTDRKDKGNRRKKLAHPWDELVGRRTGEIRGAKDGAIEANRRHTEHDGL